MFRGGHSWIGLQKHDSTSTDKSASAQFWLDGSSSTYRNWGDNQPDGDGLCIKMRNNGEFADRSCNIKQKFVCKKDGG